MFFFKFVQLLPTDTNGSLFKSSHEPKCTYFVNIWEIIKIKDNYLIVVLTSNKLFNFYCSFYKLYLKKRQIQMATR